MDIGIRICVTIVALGRALTFFVAPFGPAFGFVVFKVMAVIAFNVVHVALLLSVCSKSFIIAVILFTEAIFVVVLYKSNDSVGGDWCAHLVGGCSDGLDDTSVGLG